MRESLDRTIRVILDYIPNLIGAIVILIVGWLIARLLSALVGKVIRHTGLDKRLSRWIGGKDTDEGVNTEQVVSKTVFYLLMIFVLVAFFQVLGITFITEPLNRLLTVVLEFIPRLIGAGLLLLVAWIIASILRLVILRVLSATGLDKRFSSQAGIEEGRSVPLSKTLADIAYWLVFLLFLPAILNALALQGLLEPVNGMVSKILAFLPNILTAALILVIGWFLARIVQRIVTNLLAAIGTDRLSERVGLNRVLGTQQLSGVLGLIVYVLILIPVLIAALNALKLEAITQPASNMLNTILDKLPDIFAAILILTIAYVVGRVVATLITSLLTGIGFNTLLARLGIGRDIAPGKRTPSDIVGYLVLVAIMLFATTAALRQLGLVVLADLIAEFIVFASHVILGLIIFAIGLYLANLAYNVVQASGTPRAGLLALAAQVSIIVLAGAIALRQMGIANEIINLAFGLLLGAIAVAVAIAFGLGGREAAARQIEEWRQSIKSKED
jgi:hypothetical protein